MIVNKVPNITRNDDDNSLKGIYNEDRKKYFLIIIIRSW